MPPAAGARGPAAAQHGHAGGAARLSDSPGGVTRDSHGAAAARPGQRRAAAPGRASTVTVTRVTRTAPGLTRESRSDFSACHGEPVSPPRSHRGTVTTRMTAGLIDSMSDIKPPGLAGRS